MTVAPLKDPRFDLHHKMFQVATPVQNVCTIFNPHPKKYFIVPKSPLDVSQESERGRDRSIS